MNNQDIISAGQKVLFNTYARLPMAIVKGQGARVCDADGKEYLDFVAGIAVNSVGHCHPAVVAAIQEQAATLIHCSNLYWVEGQVLLAQLLTDNSDFDKVFFCNSGAEANEGALKLARKYAWSKGHPERYEVISMLRSFHGRTLATLTATGQEKVQKGFSPLPSGFKYVPYNDIEAIKAAKDEKTCAILLEPVQGEGGVIVPDIEYMQAVEKFCHENDLLLICDEVQTGLCRTGHFLAYQHFGIKPDILTVAKALGGGGPIGAFMATDEVAAAFLPGDHGTTFGGNPLMTAAGIASVETMLKEGLAEKAVAMGEYLRRGLAELQKQFSFINSIRGLGLLLGAECDIEVKPIVDGCLARGLLIGSAGLKVLRFVPPLIITEKDVDEALAILSVVLREVQDKLNEVNK